MDYDTFLSTYGWHFSKFHSYVIMINGQHMVDFVNNTALGNGDICRLYSTPH